MSTSPVPRALTRLTPDMVILVGGDRCVEVGEDLAAAFAPGDRLVVVADTGTLLHLTAAAISAVDRVVSAAEEAFEALATVSDERIEAMFESMAKALEDPGVVSRLRRANETDVESARARGRSTGRLVLDDRMLVGMIEGLRGWARIPSPRGRHLETVTHDGWRVDAVRAPLGIVGFVFEGRPNVIVDAAGVLRSGNTAVLRIGSDALGTARALMDDVVRPALRGAGLHEGSIGLVDDPTHASGWALFDDSRLGLAVARGSGPAVAQLGAVARQAGVPVSLHGTGGAWLVLGEGAEGDWVEAVVAASLDRKVCNTLNVCCVLADRAEEMLPRIGAGIARATGPRGGRARVHGLGDVSASDLAQPEVIDFVHHDGAERRLLAQEWEWDEVPELTVTVAENLDQAIEWCNAHSPRFVACLASTDALEQERFFEAVDAPFVGNGFTRWVDGQYALGRPELGLSNWEHGRLLSRGGVLSGDSVYTVRLRAHQNDPTLHR